MGFLIVCSTGVEQLLPWENSDRSNSFLQFFLQFYPEDELAKSSAFFISNQESVSGKDITGRENVAYD